MKENTLKNIEQLRYRIVLEIKKLSNQSKGDEGNIESYFVASIVDYVVGNSLQDAIKESLDGSFLCVIAYFGLIVGLAVLFWLVSRAYCYLVKKRKKIKRLVEEQRIQI